MKDIKKLETALVLYYTHCAVSAALETAENPEDVAGHIHMTCCSVEEGTDMVARIKADDLIPATVTPWLIKLWETLSHNEAEQACEMVGAMLIGASLYDRVSDLECYGIF